MLKRMTALLPAKFGEQAVLALALRVAWATLSYAGVVLLARWFGEEQYGYFSFALSIATFLGMATALGSMTTAIRYLGSYKASDSWAKMAGLRIYGRRVVLASSLLVAVAGAISSPLIGRLAEIPPMAVIFGFLLVPLFAMNDLNAGIGRSFGAIFAALGPRDVIWRGVLIALGALVFSTPALSRLTDPMSVLLGMSVGVLAVLVAWQSWAVTRHLPREVVAERNPAFEPLAWRRTAVPIWLSSLATVACRSLDVVIVTFLFNPIQAGFYFAASRTAALAGFVEQSLNVVVSPQIADSYHAGETRRLQRVIGIAALLSFSSSLFMSLGFILFGKPLLEVLGTGFGDAYGALVILSIGLTIGAASGPAGLLLELSGNEWWSTAILTGSSVLGLSLSAVAGLHFGLAGVAAGVAIAIIGANWGRAVAARYRTGHDTSLLGLLSPGSD